MGNIWRRLDNTAKIFSVEDRNNINTFRLSAILKEEVDFRILKISINEILKTYSGFKVKLKTGFFWNYLVFNEKDFIVSEEVEMSCKSINFRRNNDYLFKVTYFNNKINLDVFHILTDGVGATIFFREILYKYLSLKYCLNVDSNDNFKTPMTIKDENLGNFDKNMICREYYKRAFLINEKSNLKYNKTYHYILDLNKFKSICKKSKQSLPKRNHMLKQQICFV